MNCLLQVVITSGIERIVEDAKRYPPERQFLEATQ
jgi:hypothetical protein